MSPEMEGKNITLWGVSFSAQSLSQFLLQTGDDVLSRINNLIMMGGMLTVDDLKDKKVVKMTSLIRRLGLEGLAQRFGGVMKMMIAKDPQLLHEGSDDQEQRNRDLQVYIDRVTNKALIAQLSNMLMLGDNKRERIDSIPTLIVWWEDDIISPDGMVRFQDIFQKRTVANVPHHHGWLGSSAKFIDPLVRDFLKIRAK